MSLKLNSLWRSFEGWKLRHPCLLVNPLAVRRWKNYVPWIVQEAVHYVFQKIFCSLVRSPPVISHNWHLNHVLGLVSHATNTRAQSRWSHLEEFSGQERSAGRPASFEITRNRIWQWSGWGPSRSTKVSGKTQHLLFPISGRRGALKKFIKLNLEESVEITVHHIITQSSTQPAYVLLHNIWSKIINAPQSSCDYSCEVD